MLLDAKDAHFSLAGLCSSEFFIFYFFVGSLSSQCLGLLTCTPGARLAFARFHG